MARKVVTGELKFSLELKHRRKMADRERATSLENMLTIHSSFRVILVVPGPDPRKSHSHRHRISPVHLYLRPSMSISDDIPIFRIGSRKTSNLKCALQDCKTVSKHLLSPASQPCCAGSKLLGKFNSRLTAVSPSLFLSSIEIQFYDRIPVGGPSQVHHPPKFSCHQISPLNLAFPITLL